MGAIGSRNGSATEASNSRTSRAKRHTALGLCHYCKAPGHSVWDCEAKRLADSHRPGLQVSRGGRSNGFGRGGGLAGRGGRGNPGGFQNGGGYQAPAAGHQVFGTNQPTRTYQPNTQNRQPPSQYYQPRYQQQLNTVQGYIEAESLTPSESTSNTPYSTMSPPSDLGSGNATPPQ
ncbi:uncharacterized protein EAF01_010116 [Botrytis porri]|uniref:uncharacterized protein n=1 Tax=Botrytis porri TaxID=87229 RepID=UPI00190144F4|nr:uncharacterized protein EAF01_010116 [Botrytis porri]KAF7894666.1 hypothetical protein EAF01_010116 [Botrytis porri]